MGREIKPEQERGKDQATADSQQPGQAPRQQAQGDQDRHIPPGHHGVRSMLPSSMPATGRLLPTQQADGHTQMALDAWLLKRSNRFCVFTAGMGPGSRSDAINATGLNTGMSWPAATASAWCDARAEVGPCFMPAVSPMP